MSRIAIPPEIVKGLPHEDCVVNVRLRSGRIVRDLLCKGGRSLTGQVVEGRQDGVIDVNFDFDADDIVGVKPQTIADTFAPTRALKEKLHAL